MPLHSLLLHFWAEKVWARIWAYLDRDRNGFVDSQEIKAISRSEDGEVDQGVPRAHLKGF